MHKEGLVRRCVTGLLCLLLTACGEPEFRPLAAGETILAFGDSLTEGRGVSPAQSYPSVLASLSGHPVINGGVSGELSQAGRARLPALLAEHRPALVILLEGGNDMLRGSGEGALKANLAAMIEAVQGSGAQVLLVPCPASPCLPMVRPFTGSWQSSTDWCWTTTALASCCALPGSSPTPCT